ncbi:MAG TPA: DNA polymerase III subunit gamma and tau, partial [Candidatus Nanopelagicales bacterium]|nr:DNA polymerase III subunit gamma and tau [Candidatus Nanopelagicales bacterium]
MSLALYRTYRPARLADVVGQEHITAPLTRALENDRVHHAYLFSGPRGCGKTSTARIMARSLNCEQGPTPEPCGQCQSCIDLAAGGSGSIDVIELDAASHGGVDDTRELRERAMFAPASSRYKVYIIDEAHMVSTAGFNALLKLVEEPPEHVRFIFATTDPDKVLPTIRSRTHNYAFRLVGTRELQQHLASICEQEGVPADPAALALVARAGAGSVRDSLSILGQVIAGSGPDGITYREVADQLGVTDTALLDATIAAISARDGSALFEVIESVVDTGHDPRRFVSDLLERMRDLIVVQSVPDASSRGLIDAPDDEIERIVQQAALLGPAEASRAADVVNVALGELKGATAPRLRLEMMAARLLVPAADDSQSGDRARLEHLERVVAALPATG